MSYSSQNISRNTLVILKSGVLYQQRIWIIVTFPLFKNFNFVEYKEKVRLCCQKWVKEKCLYQRCVWYRCRNVSFRMHVIEKWPVYLKQLRQICLSLSVRMKQFCSHWTNFHEIWYLNIFRKSVEKIQRSLKSDKNNGYFTRRSMYIYDNIWLYS
jgi:hypothetical protein